MSSAIDGGALRHPSVLGGSARVSASALVSLAALLLLSACGAAAPRESDIFHDPALRRGEVGPRDGAESELLASLGRAPAEGGALGAYSVGPVYSAASGRRCRSVGDGSATEARLACDDAAGVWRFVPSIFELGETTTATRGHP